MSEVAEIERIKAEAIADEAIEQPEPAQAGQALEGAPVDGDLIAQEFAAFLSMAANVAATASGIKTIPERFSEAANLQIARAAVALCQRYGYDAKKVLLGGDSVIGLWLGLGVSIAIPGAAVYKDIQVLRAKEVREAANDDGQQSGQ